MAYIGTNAPTGFSTSAKDTFSGDNSTTAFTMSRGQSTANDVQVFVDNVRQEPVIAYNVSGATLTFTEAPPTGTNNIYCVHNSNQAVSVLPPADLGSRDYVFGDDVSLQSDAAVLNMGLDSEIKITHVHNTGILLTDSGGSPTLQLHDSNESVSSDGSNLILTSGGTAFKIPTADGTASGQVLQTDASGNLSFGNLSSISITGTTPTLTIGDAGAEDTKIVFDGNAQDFYVGLDDTDDDLKIGIGSTVGTTAAIVIDENGHVSMPLQCAFLVENSDDQTNMAINTSHVIQLATERFDLNGDFNNSTDTFTAPITGKYHFDAVVTFINYPIDMTYAFTQLSFSNLTTEIYFDGAVFDEVAGQNIAFTHSILMDMDANDTVQLKYFQQDGTASADISGTSSQLTTYLSGHLVA